MQQAPKTSSIRPPSQRIADSRTTQDNQNIQPGLAATGRRESIPRRPISLKAQDASKPLKSDNTSVSARSISPTKLPLGTSQKPPPTKQPLATPASKASETADRPLTLGKAPTLRKPSESATSTASRQSRIELKSAQSVLPKRQLSPSRTTSNSLQAPKSKAPNVSTRSSSIAARNLAKADAEVTVEKKTRPVVTPPSSERPAFTTNQQKFSPQKVSSGSAKDGSSQGQNQYSKENLESNVDLLHLHSLHRDSAKVQQEWLESAKLSFRTQFELLTKSLADLNDKEQDYLEQGNAAAIISWGGQSGGDTIERKVQLLSSAITEAYGLTESDGKYTMAVQAFEHWYETAHEIQRRRLDRRANRVDVIEGLGDGWKAEVASLQSRVIQVSNNILSLGDVQTQSDLSRCVTTLSEMLMNMLEELEMMQFIEDSMVEQEQFWVQTSIERMASDLRGSLPE